MQQNNVYGLLSASKNVADAVTEGSKQLHDYKEKKLKAKKRENTENAQDEPEEPDKDNLFGFEPKNQTLKRIIHYVEKPVSYVLRSLYIIC